MKKPDEIKKGLECCSKPIGFGTCASACPFDDDETDEIYNCTSVLSKDALEYIQRLEADNESKQKRIDELESSLAQVERENEALRNDLKLADTIDCTCCIHNQQIIDTCDCNCNQCKEQCVCNTCRNNDKYEWRGVCSENTKGE